MAEQRYVIRQQDKNAAVSYLDQQIASNPQWLSLDDAKRSIAEREYRDAKFESISLNDWCWKWLDETRWAQLKSAIQSARDRIESQKYRPQLKTISLTHNAWQILTDLAKHDEATLSEVIIKRLGGEQLNSYDQPEKRRYININKSN